MPILVEYVAAPRVELVVEAFAVAVSHVEGIEDGFYAEIPLLLLAEVAFDIVQEVFTNHVPKYFLGFVGLFPLFRGIAGLTLLQVSLDGSPFHVVQWHRPHLCHHGRILAVSYAVGQGIGQLKPRVEYASYFVVQ